jgi:hypothetical protein
MTPIHLRLLAVVTFVPAAFAGAVYLLEGSSHDSSRSNVCTPAKRQECFVPEHAVVAAAGEDRVVLRRRDRPGEITVAEPGSGWEGSPPGLNAPVVLERWEGDEITYVFDRATGRRHQIESVPDRAGRAFLGVFLLFATLAVSVTTFTWLRGY